MCLLVHVSSVIQHFLQRFLLLIGFAQLMTIFNDFRFDVSTFGFECLKMIGRWKVINNVDPDLGSVRSESYAHLLLILLRILIHNCIDFLSVLSRLLPFLQR